MKNVKLRKNLKLRTGGSKGAGIITECYDDACVEELEKSVIVQFANVIIDVFENSEAVAEGFSYARYFNQKGISSKWKKDVLVKLGEKLMKEKAMQDFHRIVLDIDYRNRLLNEQ